MLKIEREQLVAQLAAVNAMLVSLPTHDYLGRIGFEARRQELQEQIAALGDIVERRAQVALYFGGGPVIGSQGVQATFGTNVMYTFQDLISKVWSTLGTGTPLQQMGPIRDKEASQLHITNVLHGSFGFLLEELDPHGEPMFETPLNRAADWVTNYILSFASEDDDSFSELIQTLNPRVFQSLRVFFNFIHKDNATFRIVEGDVDRKFDRQDIERAWRRAEESNIADEQILVEGRLLGIIPMRRRFELQTADGTVVEGKVAEGFSNTYLENMSTQQFAGRRWRAVLNRRTISKIGRLPTENFTLLELEELQNSP
jgi:hypothetical protein